MFSPKIPEKVACISLIVSGTSTSCSQNNFNSAVYFLEKSVSILPRSAEVIDHLGDCYLMLNRKKEAVFEWNKALKYEKDKNVLKFLNLVDLIHSVDFGLIKKNITEY